MATLGNTLRGLGHLVAYYPGLNKVTGSVTATLLLCQLNFWTDENENDGWVQKTMEEITAGTGLSRKEQMTARRLLRQRGLLREALRGLPRAAWYYIDQEALEKAWEAALLQHKYPNGTTGNTQRGPLAVPKGDSRRYPKGTTGGAERGPLILKENTQNNTQEVQAVEKDSNLQTTIGSQSFVSLDSDPSQQPSRAREEDEPATPKGKKRRVAKAVLTRCPVEIEPTEHQVAYAEAHGIDLAFEVQRFQAHHESKGNRMASWEAALWTWLHNCVKFATTRPPSNGPVTYQAPRPPMVDRGPAPGLSDWERAYEERYGSGGR